MKNKVVNSRIRCLIAFCIPVLIICICFICLGITPFGDKTVLIWDAKLQHKDYYGYLWDVLHGKASLQYSAGKSLGGRMIGIIGFYIGSPLNIVLYFFKKTQIAEFMAFMVILRIGLSAVTSHYYLLKRFQLDLLPALLISTSYAMMEYNIYYSRNNMWLDGVIILPIVALGVWRLINERKYILLWASVIWIIISNWYTGYMVCLFSGIYFFYEYLICQKQNRDGIKAFFRIFTRYVAVMFMAVMSSMIMLFPACLSLLNGKATHNALGITGIIKYDILHFCTGFCINQSIDNYTVVAYCGGVLLLIILYYFFDKNIDTLRDKIITAIVLLFLILSFCFKDLELLWTAFVESTSYPTRFAFIFVFFGTVIAGRVFKHLRSEKINKKALIISLLIIILIAGLLWLRKDIEIELTAIVEYSVLIAVYCALLYMFVTKKKYRKCIGITLLFLLSCELACNANTAFGEFKYSDIKFKDYVQNMESLLSQLNKGNDFFRFEKNRSYLDIGEKDNKVATCEGLMFGYNTIEHYSSAYDEYVDEFLAKMGYSDWVSPITFRCETYWNSPLLPMDSVLSVKYAMMKEQSVGYENTDMDTFKWFPKYKIYKNKYMLPLGYNVKATDENIKYNRNPYINQQKLYSSLLNKKVKFYNNVENVKKIFYKGDEVREIKVDSNGPVYLYVDGSSVHSNYYQENCNLYVDGKFKQKICSRFVINSIYLGNYKKGDYITIRIQHNDNSKAMHTWYLKQLDMNRFRKCISELKKDSESHINIKGNVIKGTYATSQKSTMMLSIPYEKAWSAYVDGQKVKVKKVAGIFMGIDMDKGTHNIYMKYTTPGFKEGAVMSSVGILIFIIFYITERKKTRKREEN